jgi:hypothetical protein
MRLRFSRYRICLTRLLLVLADLDAILADLGGESRAGHRKAFVNLKVRGSGLLGLPVLATGCDLKPLTLRQRRRRPPFTEEILP